MKCGHIERKDPDTARQAKRNTVFKKCSEKTQVMNENEMNVTKKAMN